MRKRLLKNSKVYCILDYASLGTGRNIVSLAKKAILAKTDIIQLRFKDEELSKVLKDARRISCLAKKHKVLFIINDRIDLALLVNADGVHLGQKDIPIREGRRLLGKKKIIGISTHSISQVISARKEKADYISVGPVFKTPTKPEYKAVGLKLLKKAGAETKLPIVAIGGINLKNIQSVARAGAKRVAVVRAISRAKNITKTIKLFRSELDN